MDVLAHTLWTNAAFKKKYFSSRKMRYLAAFFGILPDFIAFIPLFVYLIFSGKFLQWESLMNGSFSNPTLSFAENAYNYTHSLVIFAGVFIVVNLLINLYKHNLRNLFTKPIIFWPMLGSAFHILLDIPTHPDFYNTPFLFPISDFKYSGGISWADPRFMIVNYSMLAIVYIFFFIKLRRKKMPDSSSQNGK